MLRRYRRFNTLIVVTHGVVISSIVGVDRHVEHAEIVPFTLDLDEEPVPPAVESQA